MSVPSKPLPTLGQPVESDDAKIRECAGAAADHHWWG
jgi:hypothetical protein